MNAFEQAGIGLYDDDDSGADEFYDTDVEGEDGEGDEGQTVEPDTSFDLDASRKALDDKLQQRFEAIFEKYGKDFSGVGDEIDLRTGEIVVDNGHLLAMQNERDAGVATAGDTSFHDLVDPMLETLAVGSVRHDEYAINQAMVSTTNSFAEGADALSKGPLSTRLPDLPSDIQILAQFGHDIGRKVLEYISQQKPNGSVTADASNCVRVISLNTQPATPILSALSTKFLEQQSPILKAPKPAANLAGQHKIADGAGIGEALEGEQPQWPASARRQARASGDADLFQPSDSAPNLHTLNDSDDDEYLLRWAAKHRFRGGDFWGYRAWEHLATKNPRFEWKGWQNRYRKLHLHRENECSESYKGVNVRVDQMRRFYAQNRMSADESESDIRNTVKLAGPTALEASQPSNEPTHPKNHRQQSTAGSLSSASRPSHDTIGQEPLKSGNQRRRDFTAEDDQIITNHVMSWQKTGDSPFGTKHWIAISQQYPHHTLGSWRGRFMQAVGFRALREKVRTQRLQIATGLAASSTPPKEPHKTEATRSPARTVRKRVQSKKGPGEISWADVTNALAVDDPVLYADILGVSVQARPHFTQMTPRRDTDANRSHNRANLSMREDPLVVDDEENDGDEDDSYSDADEIVCFCQRAGYGDMIGCENSRCPYVWFHLDCVGMSGVPDGPWYCRECRTRLSKNVTASVQLAKIDEIEIEQSRSPETVRSNKQCTIPNSQPSVTDSSSRPLTPANIAPSTSEAQYHDDVGDNGKIAIVSTPIVDADGNCVLGSLADTILDSRERESRTEPVRTRGDFNHRASDQRAAYAFSAATTTQIVKHTSQGEVAAAILRDTLDIGYQFSDEEPDDQETEELQNAPGNKVPKQRSKADDEPADHSHADTALALDLNSPREFTSLSQTPQEGMAAVILRDVLDAAYQFSDDNESSQSRTFSGPESSQVQNSQTLRAGRSKPLVHASSRVPRSGVSQRTMATALLQDFTNASYEFSDDEACDAPTTSASPDGVLHLQPARDEQSESPVEALDETTYHVEEHMDDIDTLDVLDTNDAEPANCRPYESGMLTPQSDDFPCFSYEFEVVPELPRVQGSSEHSGHGCLEELVEPRPGDELCLVSNDISNAHATKTSQSSGDTGTAPIVLEVMQALLPVVRSVTEEDEPDAITLGLDQQEADNSLNGGPFEEHNPVSDEFNDVQTWLGHSQTLPKHSDSRDDVHPQAFDDQPNDLGFGTTIVSEKSLRSRCHNTSPAMASLSPTAAQSAAGLQGVPVSTVGGLLGCTERLPPSPRVSPMMPEATLPKTTATNASVDNDVSLSLSENVHEVDELADDTLPPAQPLLSTAARVQAKIPAVRAMRNYSPLHTPKRFALARQKINEGRVSTPTPTLPSGRRSLPTVLTKTSLHSPAAMTGRRDRSPSYDDEQNPYAKEEGILRKRRRSVCGDEMSSKKLRNSMERSDI